MSNQDNKQLAHAMKVVKSQIESLRQRIKDTSGEERETLRTEMLGLMSSIGLEGSVDIESPTGSSTGAHIAANIHAATEQAAAMTGKPKEVDVKVTAENGETVTTHTTIKTEKPGLWTRFKLWVSENKKKVIFGTLGFIAGAAGLWYWLNGKNTTVTVSSVADVDVNIEPVDPSIPGSDADPSIFTRVGDWIVGAAGAVKGYAQGAWNWVKGLFTRNNNVEVAVETPVEVPQAA